MPKPNEKLAANAALGEQVRVSNWKQHQETVIWTQFDSARVLHVRRMQRGLPVALCGYMPPRWNSDGYPVVGPSERDCCRRCLSISVSRRRKREWPRG